MNKFGLCIGINDYPDTGMRLKGCVNDARDWAAELASRGFEVALLLDAQATKAGIVEAVKKAIARGAPDGVVVISFSGHGTYQYDTDGDESDGLDEALCPYDIKALDTALIDDEIHALFMTRQPGVRLVLISDSCHSGTVNRDPLGRAARSDERMPRFMPVANWMSAARLARNGPRDTAAAAPAQGVATAFANESPDDDAGDVLMAGCDEGEGHFSYDASFADRPNGAFTFHALKALRELRAGASYADWHAAIARYLPSGRYPQTPQLVGNDQARERQIFG